MSGFSSRSAGAWRQDAGTAGRLEPIGVVPRWVVGVGVWELGHDGIAARFETEEDVLAVRIRRDCLACAAPQHNGHISDGASLWGDALPSIW